MKNSNPLILFLVLFAIMSGCSSTKVVSDKDPSVNFEEFKTYEFYGWRDNSDQILTRFDRERIQQSFAEEARKRGMTRVDSGGDIIVTLNVIGKVKTQQTANTTTTGMGMGMGPGMGRRGMMGPGWGWGTAHSTTVINEREYLEGSLIVEAFDPDDKLLIWQAVGTKTVSEDPQKRAKGIPKKVEAIMKKYPVKPIK